MPDFIAREDDFNFDFDLSKNFLYDVKMNGIKLTKIDIKNRTIKLLPGNNFPTFHAEISNVDIAA